MSRTWKNLTKMSETELQNFFQISNLILRTNHKEYGPFGNLRHDSDPDSDSDSDPDSDPDSDERKVYNIPIERGDVLAQVTYSFIYSGDDNEPIGFKSIKCFSFYVSNIRDRLLEPRLLENRLLDTNCISASNQLLVHCMAKQTS